MLGGACMRLGRAPRGPSAAAGWDDWRQLSVRPVAPRRGERLRPPGTLTALPGEAAGVLAVRYAWDRRCGERWAGRVFTFADTAFVRLTDVAPVPAAPAHRGAAVRYCEGMAVPAAVTAEIAGLPAGEWVVVLELGPPTGRVPRTLVARATIR